jgi:glucose-1-phosphate thymidylyltransferase
MIKGLILAGGSGSRLYPVTAVTSKQLLPVYDKPMIYYPLTVLMLAGIRDILIISTPSDTPRFEKLLLDGSQWGLSISYAVQQSPAGIAEAFLIGESFIGKSRSALILGDNIFYGNELSLMVEEAALNAKGATIFVCQVNHPERYGVVAFDSKGEASSIEEKPKSPKSRFAVTGLYFYDNQVIEIARSLKPSLRGELEISDLNNRYLEMKQLKVVSMSRGMAWLDAGTFESLIEASQFIQTVQRRQGLKIACPEEIAYRKGYISSADLEKITALMPKGEYRSYLAALLSGEREAIG